MIDESNDPGLSCLANKSLTEHQPYRTYRTPTRPAAPHESQVAAQLHPVGAAASHRAAAPGHLADRKGAQRGLLPLARGNASGALRAGVRSATAMAANRVWKEYKELTKDISKNGPDKEISLAPADDSNIFEWTVRDFLGCSADGPSPLASLTPVHVSRTSQCRGTNVEHRAGHRRRLSRARLGHRSRAGAS